jgi:formylmethanofuran dehydrogenase subunit E
MKTNRNIVIPDGIGKFHGHICLFMPIGYRMGFIVMC